VLDASSRLLVTSNLNKRKGEDTIPLSSNNNCQRRRSMNNVQEVGWSFADLNDPTKEKKIKDPITVLVYAALFPCFEEGSKVALSGQKISIQQPSEYTRVNLLGKEYTSQSIYRGLPFSKEDNNNLKVFQLNTINAAEIYSRDTYPEIIQLFTYARDGIPAAKIAYLKEDKTSPCDAIDGYRNCLNDVIEGKYKFIYTLSEAEEKVKLIWSKTELEWLNVSIRMILENKQNRKSVKTHLQNMKNILDEKEAEFNAICDLVKNGKLDTHKRKKSK
jgi:hypothetical protein